MSFWWIRIEILCSVHRQNMRRGWKKLILTYSDSDCKFCCAKNFLQYLNNFIAFALFEVSQKILWKFYLSHSTLVSFFCKQELFYQKTTIFHVDCLIRKLPEHERRTSCLKQFQTAFKVDDDRFSSSADIKLNICFMNFSKSVWILKRFHENCVTFSTTRRKKLNFY